MQSVSVLVVEDEPLIGIDLEDAVREGGFSPALVTTGEEAIVKLDASSDIRALVTDINLGNGVKGWHIARYAREQNPAIAVVYVSSVSRDEWSAQGVPDSILIQKPFAPSQIVTAISQLVNAAVLPGNNTSD